MKKQVLLFLLMLMPLMASAFDMGIDGICYNLDSTNKVAKVTTWGTNNSKYYTGSVVIPNTVYYGGITYSVTTIGDNAFKVCSGLTSLTIPNSVTSIGDNAFSGCTGLTSLTIPNSVTSIGDNAFYNCIGLTSMTIPNSVTSIRNGAFQYCSGLTSITIPNNVTSIGDNAFRGCSSLTSVTIPNSVTTIGSSAFYGCSGLTSVTIPNSVTSIGSSAFGWCSSLTSVKVESGNLSYDSRNNCNAIIKTSTNELVIGCKTTTIPNSVTSIGKSAFSSCIGLTTVTIPNSVTSIGKSAFSSCSSLTSVTLPNSVTSIGSNAFEYCNSLTSVNINDMVAWCNISFGDSYANPLYYAKHLYLNGEEVTDLVIPNGVTNIGNYAFVYCTSLTSATIPNSVTTIGVNAFRRCSSLTSVTIGNNVTSIGLSAFDECNNITAIYITDVAAWCQLNGGYQLLSPTCHLIINGLEMKYLKNLVIPDDVASIQYAAFQYSTGLTSVTIGNNVTSIESQAFYECSDITSITIGSGIKAIGSKAFSKCTELKEMFCYAIDVPTISSDTFQDTNYIKWGTLYVPEQSVELYKKSIWSQYFGSIVGISGGSGFEKCAKPIITLLANGKVKVESATEGATCVTNITASNADPLTEGEISLNTPLVVYTVSSYATAEGYDDSDVATFTFRWEKTEGDMNGDGMVNISDVVKLVNMILGL